MLRWSRTATLLVSLGLAWGALAWQTSAGLWAQSTAAPATATAAAGSLDVQLGLGGWWKLGHVCPVRVTIPRALLDQCVALELATLDGDGVDVVYRREIEPHRIGPAGHVWMPIRIGRRSANLDVRLLGAEGELLAESLDPNAVHAGLASTQPFVVALGSAMGIDELVRRSADGANATLATAVIDSVDLLPASYRDFSSCDLLLLSTRDMAFLQSMTAPQWAAIDDWIRRGGGCIISLGQSAADLQSVPQLLELLPGKPVGEGRVTNPAGLESLVVTDDPLRPFEATQLELDRGEVELALRDSLSTKFPWWIAYPHGHGTMRLLASDLDSPAFAQWQDRKALWERLIEPYFPRSLLDATSEDAEGEGASYLGYNDMVGQLRATLDVFPAVHVISFGQVAAMLIAVLLLIGPLDYVVCVKWLKRPDLSWYLAGVLLLLICAGLIGLHQAIRPEGVLVNTAQIVDLDTESGQIHGRAWSHVYSGRARQVDICAATPQAQPVALDWQGLPGRGLGGLLSQLNTDRGMPPYVIDLDEAGGSHFRGVGIPAAGTKCLFASWSDRLPDIAASNLQEMSGVDQLQGELVNPLPVDLKDAMLFYHNWYYVLNSRIPPGERVLISSETIPKELTRRLNGQRNVDGNVSITRWDPADRGQLDRLLELMMFYKAAAGRNYTGLSHRYQPDVDQSNLLATDRAILIGRTEQLPVQLSVTAHDQRAAELSADEQHDIQRVWYRIAIPVAQ